MPIPTTEAKAIYTSNQTKGSGSLILKQDDKGYVTRHTYHKHNEYAFYPLHWNGYCTTVLETDFTLIKNFRMATAKKKVEPQDDVLDNPMDITTIEVGMIDIRLINEDPEQPRKTFDETFIEELAADIKMRGIIQPITVRQDLDRSITFPRELANKKCYKIVCGANRYKAAIRAGLEEVPCIVRHLNDDEAFDFQIAENLQRKNINAMEESDAFQQLLNRGLKTHEMIADLLGVSTRYVYDRLVLQKVLPEVQEAVRQNKLTITHAKQFARVPLADQQKLLDYMDDFNDWSVDDIREKVNETFRLKLDKALFDIHDAKLDKKAGACVKCNKRSGCNLLLFEDVQQDDVCFDADCWKNKLNIHITQTIDKYKAEGKDVYMLTTKLGSSNNALLGPGVWQNNIGVKDGETPIIGIICEAHDYSPWKYGEVVKLSKIVLPKDNEDEEDESNDNSGMQVNPSKPSTQGWDEKLQLNVIRALVTTYKENPQSFPTTDLQFSLIEELSKFFNQFNDETIELLIELLGFEKVEDAGNTNGVKTIEPYLNVMSIDDMLILKRLFFYIDAAERGLNLPDSEEFNDFQNKISGTGIDAKSILNELEKEYNTKLIDFSEEEN